MAVGPGRVSAHTWPGSIVPFLPYKNQKIGTLRTGTPALAATMVRKPGKGTGKSPFGIRPPWGNLYSWFLEVVSLLPAAFPMVPESEPPGFWAPVTSEMKEQPTHCSWPGGLHQCKANRGSIVRRLGLSLSKEGRGLPHPQQDLLTLT